MASHDIIVIGASAGGVRVLTELVKGLPAGLPAAIFAIMHMPALSLGILPEIISKAGKLLAHSARDGQPIYPGHIYMAPPDHHLTLEPGVVRVTRGARENFCRPAIDPLLRSAARVYGPRAIGVILTGALFDGVAGLLAIRAAGGAAVVQDPKDAEVPFLPQKALEIAGADHVVPADQLAPLLVELVHRPLAKGDETMAEVDPLEELQRVMAADMERQANGARRGTVATFTCPECGGNLWQVDDRNLVRFSCHVGHAFHGEDLLSQQSVTLEAALWTAVRIFKEKMILARQLAAEQSRRGHAESADRFGEEARLSEHYSTLIQEYLVSRREAVDSLCGAPRSDSGKPATAASAHSDA